MTSHYFQRSTRQHFPDMMEKIHSAANQNDKEKPVPTEKPITPMAKLQNDLTDSLFQNTRHTLLITAHTGYDTDAIYAAMCRAHINVMFGLMKGLNDGQAMSMLQDLALMTDNFIDQRKAPHVPAQG